MPPKASKTEIILKAKRQASIYFITVLANDTISTLKSKIVEIVNNSGGLTLNDELKPINEEEIQAPEEIPMIGNMSNSSSDNEEGKGDEDDGYDTDDTAPMVFSNKRQISIDDLQLGVFNNEGEMTELENNDNMKISSFQWNDFTTIGFKLKNEQFHIFFNEYGKE